MNTQQFASVQARVAEVCSRQAMAAVYGEAGLGKTFAVERAVRKVTLLPHVWLEFPSDPSPRYVATKLLQALTGVRQDDTLYRQTDELIELLAEEPRVVVFDEAQHLRYRAVEYIRHLWDERQTQVTMIFVGGNGCWDVLSKHPMLEARIWRPVQLQPLTPEQVLKLMPKYHAIYNDCDETLIETVDDRFAHGNFRKWAAFTATAADICAERKLSKVDTDVVEHGFWRHGGGTVDA